MDVKKSVAVPPTIVSQKPDMFIENLAGKSKKRWTYRGNLESDKNFHHVWNRIKIRDGGIVYDINDKHPIFIRLIEKFPACEQNFKNLLKLIAASLPLNQLTIDLTGNVEIENPATYSEDVAREILKVFIDGLSVVEINKLLDSLAKDCIFKNYPKLLEEFGRSVD